MITVYEAIDEGVVNFANSEDSQQVKLSESPPNLNDKVSMGSHRLWQIVALETFSGEAESIMLALVHPIDLEIPDRSEWLRTIAKAEYVAISLELKAMPNSALQLGGWSMEGKPSHGRLMGAEPTDHPTLMRQVPLPFMVDSVDTYKPLGDCCYTAIHVCKYVDSPLPELATVG